MPRIKNISSDNGSLTEKAVPEAGKKPRKKRTTRSKKPVVHKERKEHIFSLDIGTRSVIGIVAERDAEGRLHILDTERQEHKTRAMLDGQIHDVPQVAAVIDTVKKALAKRTGPLHHAAVAAAGRALYTMTAEASLEVNGIITAEQERALDFSGVQAAQTRLASSRTIEDPTLYYCVGYSTIKYTLDGNQLKTLVGQRGKTAVATVIATFLPRQVIDSMQSALHEAKLDMRALTLEPIAAINVLIPPTMRHLNLVLVDIGAGTSDVAITKNGSVIAYGMVPLAGDEITEAISQKYLLDFNVAEQLKRDAGNGKDVHFSDILGMSYDLTPTDIIDPILPAIQNLAAAIAKQIMELNGTAPQAIMLVGGGSLTPYLPKLVAEALDMPEGRVAVRRPDTIEGIDLIPDELHSPDAVTPLGILKIASLNTLHFLSVHVNNEEYSLFNFRELTVSDALLNAGINMRKYNGHPGLGLMINLGTEKKFFPGTLGTFASITLNGEDANLDSVIHDDANITVIPGKNGATPTVHLSDIIAAGQEYTIYVNGREKHIRQRITVNGKEAAADQLLADGDSIESREFKSLGEALLAAGYSPTGQKIHYTLNGQPTVYNSLPEILLNDQPASISLPIHEGDHIEYIADETPKLGDILNLQDKDTSISLYYENREYTIPSANIELSVNGRSASPGTLINEGCDITYVKSERAVTTISDALLAVNFQPPAATSHVTFTILLNGQPVDFIDPIKNGDTLEVRLTDLNNSNSQADAAVPAPMMTVPALSSLNTNAVPARQEPAAKQPSSTVHPSISDFIRHD